MKSSTMIPTIGWGSYVSKDKVKVKKGIANDERLFSLSSVTSPASRREDSKIQKLTSGVVKRGRKPKLPKEGEAASSRGPMDVGQDQGDDDGEEE